LGGDGVVGLVAEAWTYSLLVIPAQAGIHFLFLASKAVPLGLRPSGLLFGSCPKE
jgi:hypothetical protein